MYCLFTYALHGDQVLHLKGSPYEIGYAHGKALKAQIQRNVATYIDQPRPEEQERVTGFFQHLPQLLAHVPPRLHEEMQGLADGSGVPLKKIQIMNLFPEMFHCSGITVNGEATKDGSLYHVRVLDYAVGKQLQATAVLFDVEPDEGYRFINVGYAGFIGSVTGMNAQKVAIGEIGGQGYGSWDGVPMAFLMREVLENAATLEEAKEILRSSKRTCEYYYVVSDGKSDTSVGVYATAEQIQFIEPGSTYTLCEERCKGKLCTSRIATSPYQTLIYENQEQVAALIHVQPKNCIAMTGFSYPERYPILVERLLAAYGQIDASALQQIIKQPVSRPSNLHNAIFLPAALKVWISHAGPQDEPACDQPYFSYTME